MAIQTMNTAPARIGKSKGGIIGNAMSKKKKPKARAKSKAKAKYKPSYF